MASVSKQEVLENVRREVGRIAADPFAGTDYRAYRPAPGDDRLREMGKVEAPAERGPFGRWLMQQTGGSDALAMLVTAAKTDHQFPRDGDPEAVRARLRACMADGDLFDAVDDAEMDWLSY